MTAAQRDLGNDALYKIQLTYGANDDTYEEDRILSIDHIEEPDHQEATVVLDNSDLAITQDYRGYKGVISYGMAPPRASNYSACAPLWVISQENHSSEELLTVTLTLRGIPDLMAEDKASEQYTQESGDTNTVKTLLTAVVAATLAPFNHCTAYTATFDSEDSLIDTFAPADAFGISLNETRLEIIKRLLFFWKGAMRVEADGAVHFFVPVMDGTTWVTATAYSVNDYVQPVTPNNNFTYRCTTAGTTGGSEPAWPTVAGNTVADGTVVWTAVGFAYEYKVEVSGDHDLFAKVNRQRIVQPNYIEVSSSPDSDDAYTGFAEDTDSSDLTAMEKREHYYLRLASDIQATALATAILQYYQFKAQKGSASAPINVGQEVYDYVKLTDSRQDDVRIGNVGYLQRIVKDGEWLMYFSFGDVRQGGFVGLFPEISSAALTEFEGGGPIAPTLENLRQDLEGVVTYFGALVGQQGELIRQLAASLMALQTQVAMLKMGIVSSTQLQGVMDSLHVREQLRIPVGTDKYG